MRNIETFIPMGTREAKMSERKGMVRLMFKIYSFRCRYE